MRKDNLCTCTGALGMVCISTRLRNQKKIREHAGNKGAFGNAAYVYVTFDVNGS